MDIVSCTAPCDDKGRRCLAPAVATGGCPLRLRHRRARPGYHRFGGRGVLRPVITERTWPVPQQPQVAATLLRDLGDYRVLRAKSGAAAKNGADDEAPGIRRRCRRRHRM